MTAYVIVDIEVHNAENYREYLAKITPTVFACNGRYLVRGANAEVISGQWKPKRLVVMEFPDLAGLVQRMEALNWVARHPCPQDARTQRVWLSEAGRAQLPALRAAIDDGAQVILQGNSSATAANSPMRG